MSLADTPRANRLHIGIFGRRNSGKSSLINALTGQQVAVVSPVSGTTTDPVYKAMEICGVGPCMFVDTAGFDDEGALGGLRVRETEKVLDKADVVLFVFAQSPGEEERVWLEKLRGRKTPVVAVVNKVDALADAPGVARAVEILLGVLPLAVSAVTGEGIAAVLDALVQAAPVPEIESITGALTRLGDTVLLVMPQDIQAPKGRLILPQVQTLRELLDKRCLVMTATADRCAAALAKLKEPPQLIVTDSQAFSTVYALKPLQSKLTSFSVLFAHYKGDLAYFVDSVPAIDRLTEASQVLIAEACTHAPLTEDIGREKLPRLLRKHVGPALRVAVVSGADFPQDLLPYDLVIHCGACMFNRKHVLARVALARTQRVPMTNYGVALAHLAGILDKIDLP